MSNPKKINKIVVESKKSPRKASLKQLEQKYIRQLVTQNQPAQNRLPIKVGKHTYQKAREFGLYKRTTSQGNYCWTDGVYPYMKTDLTHRFGETGQDHICRRFKPRRGETTKTRFTSVYELLTVENEGDRENPRTTGFVTAAERKPKKTRHPKKVVKTPSPVPSEHVDQSATPTTSPWIAASPQGCVYQTCWRMHGSIEGGDSVTIYVKFPMKMLTPAYIGKCLRVKIGGHIISPRYVGPKLINGSLVKHADKREVERYDRANVEIDFKTPPNAPGTVLIGVVYLGSNEGRFQTYYDERRHFEYVDQDGKQKKQQKKLFIPDDDGLDQDEMDMFGKGYSFDDSTSFDADGDPFFDDEHEIKFVPKIPDHVEFNDWIGKYFSNCAGHDAIMVAIAKNKTDFVKTAIREKGIDVNYLDNFGNSYLHWANYYSRSDIIEFLKSQKGVDVNAKNSFGKKFNEWIPEEDTKSKTKSEKPLYIKFKFEGQKREIKYRSGETFESLERRIRELYPGISKDSLISVAGKIPKATQTVGECNFPILTFNEIGEEPKTKLEGKIEEIVVSYSEEPPVTDSRKKDGLSKKIPPVKKEPKKRSIFMNVGVPVLVLGTVVILVASFWK